MRRAFLCTAVAVLSTFLVPSASAKFENATITISGPGLAAPIELSGQDALVWERYGVFEQKWRFPNVDGLVDPNADLGPAYEVRVVFECPHRTQGGFAETLYPYAPGAPQIYTAPGTPFCGSTISPGYFPASVRLLHALVAKGLPKTAPAATPLPAPDRSSAKATPTTTIALLGLLALVALSGLTAWRRRDRAAA